MARSIFVFALSAFLTGNISALAQGRDPVTVEAGGLFSWQRSIDPVDQDPSRPRPGVGGSAFGWIAGAAVGITPSLDAAVEISDTAAFDATQTTDYQLPIPIENQHHELIVSPMLRVHSRATGVLRVEGVGGVAFVREATAQQQAELTGYPPQVGMFRPEPEITRLAFGLTGGLNLAVRMSRHISLVPEVRVYWISRADPNSGAEPSASLALDPLVLRAAVTLRTSF